MTRLDLVVGPNGAGKSTYIRFVLAPARPGVPFVNADVIAAERWPDPAVAMRNAAEASQLAERAREQLLAQRRPMIAETVASHPSKVDLVARAKDADYLVHVHVMLVGEDQVVERVARRVDAGGHDVPEDKTRARYRRLWQHVAQMVEVADVVEVFDNSGEGPRTVALFIAGSLVGSPHWPRWTPEDLIQAGRDAR
ncbi:MAG: AAA family ATPase [Egicoccus sp.]